MGIAADIVVIVVASLIGAILVGQLKQPPLVGYILAGVILGPHVSGLITDLEEINLLAEIGVSLLMFALGLQFQLKDLQPVRRIALFGTPIQIVLTAVLGVGIGALFGWTIAEGIWFGALASLSSTVVILKVLQARGLMNTLSTRVILGIMIAQDLAVVPLIILLPQINDLGAGLPILAFALLRAAIFMTVMIFVGTRLIPRLMAYIAGWNSRELFLVGVTAIGLGVGYATFLFGLSFAFGAFVAGVVLAESDYSHQALGDIIPLRDLFSLLFFASVGMLLDPAFLIDNMGMVLAVVALTILGKGLILGLMARGFGYANVIPLAVAFTMFQVGEFSFVLAGVGVAEGLITTELYTLILSTAIITIILTPGLSSLINPLYQMQRRIVGGETVQTVAHLPKEGLRDHVIVAGGGHIGHYVAKVLKQMNMSFVVIDLNPERVDKLKAEGIPVLYGDASHPIVLEAAQFRTACLLIDTIPSIGASQAILDHVRHAGSDLHVVARVENEDELKLLNRLGVYEIVMPEFEAGLELVRQALLHLNVSETDIRTYVDECRFYLYEPVRATIEIDKIVLPETGD